MRCYHGNKKETKAASTLRPRRQPSWPKRFVKALVDYRYLHLMIIPGMMFFFAFKYIPMYGILIAFKNYRGAAGGLSAIMGAP